MHLVSGSGHILEKVAQSMSRNYGVTVRFRGNSATTNGKEIILPSLPDNIDPVWEDKIRGYCDHEIGHVLFSEPDLPTKLARESMELKVLTNAFEDVRVEKLLGEKFPGAKVNMEATMKAFLKEGAVENIVGKMIVQARQDRLGYDLGVDYRKEVFDTFGEEIFDRILNCNSSSEVASLAREILRENATPEALPPTPDKEGDEDGGKGDGEGDKDGKGKKSKSKDKKKDKGEPKEDSDSQDGDEDSDGGQDDGEGDPSDEGQDGEDGSDGDGDGSDGEGEDGDEQEGDDGQGDAGGESDDSESNVKKNEEGKPGSGDAGEDAAFAEDDIEEDEQTIGQRGEGSGSDDVGPYGNLSVDSKKDKIDLAEATSEYKDAFAKIAEEMGNLHEHGKYSVFSREFDKVEPIKTEGHYRADSLEVMYEEMKKEMGSLSATKNKIAAMFSAKAQSRWRGDRERGKVNTKALARMQTGNYKVFKEKVVSNARDTAALFLVDFSGSMNGSKIRQAMQTALFFLETLQMTNVKHEVLGFTTGDLPSGEVFGRGGMHVNARTFSRVEPLLILEVKRFDEAFNASIKGRVAFAGRGGIPMCNNVDGESVQYAYERLKTRREKRKILFVLSDGQPACYGNGLVHQHTKDVAKMIEADPSVELFAIGFGSDSVKSFYKNHIVLDGRDMGKLGEVMAAHLRRFLVDDARQA